MQDQILSESTSVKSLRIKNFRRIHEMALTVIADRKPLILLGDNGSGKTSILYAIMLFSHAYNRYASARGKIFKVDIPSGAELAMMLNDVSFLNSDTVTSLRPRVYNLQVIRSSDGTLCLQKNDRPVDSYSIVSMSINGIDYDCTIDYDTYAMVVNPNPDKWMVHPEDGLLRIAFVGNNNFNLPSPSVEVRVGDILSSSAGCIRGFFKELCLKDKEDIAGVLAFLFPEFLHTEESHKPNDPSLYMVFTNDMEPNRSAFRRQQSLVQSTQQQQPSPKQLRDERISAMMKFPDEIENTIATTVNTSDNGSLFAHQPILTTASNGNITNGVPMMQDYEPQEQLKSTTAVGVELASTGQSFRKIFVTLVLLWTLAERRAFHRICMIEEPESQIHPLIASAFIPLLINKANSHNIQLIFTTTNPYFGSTYTSSTYAVVPHSLPIPMPMPM